MSADNFPQLKPLSLVMQAVYTEFVTSLSSSSFRYNNASQISSINTDPGHTEGGEGWAQRGGFGENSRSMTLHGRTYHCVRDANRSGVIRRFTYVGDEDQEAAEALQFSLDLTILRVIRQQLLLSNPYFRALKILGECQHFILGVRLSGPHSNHTVGAFARTGREE